MSESLIIGMGQVGNGLFNVLLGKTSVATRDKEQVVIGRRIDILHICIPYSDDFKREVRGYKSLYNPKLTIVYSTVPIGTCEEIGVVHSPVEGKHPELAKSIMIAPRWLGSSDKELLGKAVDFWAPFTQVRALPSADYTEWLKLRSTAKYGINIVWSDYENKVSKEIGMDYSAIRQFDMDYNELYENLGLKDFKRYILNPPKGKIGGHCLVPNAKMLNEQFPNKWLEEIK